jgi:hypothetical protein
VAKEGQGKKMGQIIAKALADEAFKQRLLADAAAVLKEEGVAVPEGVTVTALENTETAFYLVIPRKPSFELTDDEMAACAGGGGGNGGCCLYDSHGTGILW